MSRKNNPSKRQGGGAVSVLLVLLIILLILGSAMMIYLSINVADYSGTPNAPAKQPGNAMELPNSELPPVQTETEPPETTMPEPEHVVSTATLSATGDLLMHTPLYHSQYNSACYKGGDDYDFSPIFKFVKEYTTAADYMIANLETTLYGPGKAYSGFPMFNTPDQIVDGAKDAGFDMLLTANNHCNDTGMDGILRTLEVVRDKGLKTLGTNMNSEEKRYELVEVNGIKLGLMCFSYDDSQNSSRQAFNGNPVYDKDRGTVNSFPILRFGKDRGPFFTELETQIKELKEQGADATILFLHWGIEYQLTPNQEQKDLAQKFCDMGVDVIVGGHPHVIQPVELLTSTTDPNHKTVCLYSLGNAVSNQRAHIMQKYIPTPHTEDGMLFNITFEKYSDGTAYLSKVDVIPTWTDRHTNESGKLEYNILPLEDARRDQWQEMFSIDDSTLTAASKSYDRTMKLVGEGLEASNAYLTQMKEQRDADYLAAVMNPGAKAPAPTAAPTPAAVPDSTELAPAA